MPNGPCYCDPTTSTDSDGDGVPDECDGCPDTFALQNPDPDCGCDDPNSLPDGDVDGTPDCKDGCPEDTNKTEPGECGCGEPETDSDSDGVADCNDLCPNDPNKTSPGKCGCGTPEGDCKDEDLGNPPPADPGPNTPGNENNGGDPINIYTGNNYVSKKDITFASSFQGGLIFNRFYNSQAFYNGPLGYGWTHSFNVLLNLDYDTENSIIKIKDGTGRGIYFQYNGTTYSGMNGELSTVEPIGDTYVWILANGMSYGFDNTGRLSYIEDINNNRQSLVYNTNDLVETVTDEASGRVLTFYYDAELRIDYITGPATETVIDGIWVSYGYDTNNNLISVTYADGSGDDFEYNDPYDSHNITGQLDKQGHFINSWSYDQEDRAYENIHRNGQGVFIDYSDPNNVKLTDAYGVPRTMTIDEKNGRKVITNISCDTGKSVGGPGVVRYLYNYDRYILEKEYENGRIDTFSNLDSRGNPQIMVKSSGSPYETTLYFTWHPVLNKELSRTELSLIGNGNKETIWDYDDDYDDIPNESPKNRISRYIEKGFTHDKTGAVVPYQYITEYRYNTEGQVTSIDGPLDGEQDKVEFTYNPVTGDLLTVVNPVTGTTSFTYDNAGNALTITDVNGIVTTNTYDGKNRLLTVTRDGKITTRSYTLAGKLETVTDAEQRSLNYTYESQYGRLDRLTDALGNYHLYGYNTQGDVIDDSIFDSTDTKQKHTRFDYEGEDLPGELWKQINHDDTFTEFKYDSSGNRYAVVSADNKTVQYTFDEFDRIKSVIQPGSVTTTYDYDLHGNLVSVTDANLNTTTYTYDDLGRRVKTVSPDTGTTRYSYTSTGKFESKTVNSGNTTGYTYDAIGRLTGITYADTTQNVIFTYDEGVNGKGRLTGKTGPGYTYAYTYNTMGQVESETLTIGSNSHTTGYSYDNSGILTGMTYPDGRTVTYGLNGNGQYLSASTTKSSATNALISNATYKPFGPMAGLDFGNGIQLSRFFDLGYTLSGLSAGSVQNLTYDKDPAGKITSIVNNLDPSRNQAFTYDNLNRLTTADGVYGSLTYIYDDVGNRQTLTENSSTDMYRYLTGSNIIDTVDGEFITSYLHDNNGNILTATKGQYGALPEVTADYLYNINGQRIRKTSGGLTVYYHYDLAGNLIAESDGSGTLVKSYVYMGGSRIATIAVDGAICYYHNNHLETPEVMTDESGSVVWKADYKPFGYATVDPASTVVNDFRFPGQIYDSETGYHYNWNRYYDPGTGRYLTADPIGLHGGLNLYGYVGGNPVNAIDPKGEAVLVIAGGGYIVVGGALVAAGIITAMIQDVVDAIVESSSDESPYINADGTVNDSGSSDDCEKKGKYKCEGYGQYDQIGTPKHVRRGDTLHVAYGKTEKLARDAWINKVQNASPPGFTARHIMPKCTKVR